MSDLAEQPADEQRGVPWKWLLMLAATAVILYLLVSQLAGADQLWQAIQRAQVEWLVLSLVLLVINLLLAGVRWSYVVQIMGFELPLRRTMDAILSTWPISVATPSRAGDFMRAVCVRDIVPTIAASSSVLAEKVVDVQSLCLLALIGSLSVGLWEWSVLAGLMLAGAWFIVALLFWKNTILFKLPLIGRAEDKIRKLFAAFGAFRRHPARYLWLSLISLSSWVTAMTLMYSLTLVFQADISILQVLALWPMAIFVGMLPLTLAGVGTRDAAFVTLLAWTSSVSVAEAPVLASTLAYALVGTWLPAIVGLPLMIRRMHNLPAPMPEDSAHSSKESSTTGA